MLTKTTCPVCNNQAFPLDVVDFNKICLEFQGKFLPMSGIPIYYFHCHSCFFTFAPEFENWTDEEFMEKIYNDDYLDLDPDYLEERPQVNFQFLKSIFNEQKNFISHLDYGGGNGRLSFLLNEDGWNSKTYDPFPATTLDTIELGKYNLITAFEVFEHVPDVNVLMNNLKELMTDDCIIIFSTLISDGNIKINERIQWWYASPRNGHISLFSKDSLKTISDKYLLNFGSFSEGLHCFFGQVPFWARHIIKQDPNPRA
jgi:SAM-dependent methyltransferase